MGSYSGGSNLPNGPNLVVDPSHAGYAIPRCLVLYVIFVNRRFSFCPFSFGHCVGYDYLFDIFKHFCLQSKFSLLYIYTCSILSGGSSGQTQNGGTNLNQILMTTSTKSRKHKYIVN
jgi:hypothetical protein